MRAQTVSACEKRKGKEIVHSLTKLQEVCGKADEADEVRALDDSGVFASLGTYLCDQLADASATSIIVNIVDCLHDLMNREDYVFPAGTLLVGPFTEACLRLGANRLGDLSARRDAITILTDALKDRKRTAPKKSEGSIMLESNDAQLQDLARSLATMPCFELQEKALEILYILNKAETPNKKQKQAKMAMLDSAPRVVQFEFAEGCFAPKKLKEMGFSNATRRVLNAINESNPNISPFAIKNVTFGTSRRELQGANTNWLDVGRNELRIDLQDPVGGDAHVLIEYQNIVDGSVRLINHSGAILRFDVPVKHVKLNDLSAEASQEVLSTAPEDNEQPWAIWIWLKGDDKARCWPSEHLRPATHAAASLSLARAQDFGRMVQVMRETMPAEKMNEESDSQLSQPPEPEPPLRSPSSSVSETPNKPSEKGSRMSAATTHLPRAAPVPDALQMLGVGSDHDDDRFGSEGRVGGGAAADTTVEPSERFEKPLSNSTEPDLDAQEDQARGAGKSIFRTSAEKERELASRSPAYQDDEIDDSEQQFLPPASAISNAADDDVDEDDDSDYEASQQQPKRTPANGSRRGTQPTSAKQPVTLKKVPSTKASAKPQWTEEMTFELIGTILDTPGSKKKEIIETFKRELEQKHVASPTDAEISRQITKVAFFDRSLKQFTVNKEYERQYWDQYDVGTGKPDGETKMCCALRVFHVSDRGGWGASSHSNRVEHLSHDRRVAVHKTPRQRCGGRRCFARDERQRRNARRHRAEHQVAQERGACGAGTGLDASRRKRVRR